MRQACLVMLILVLGVVTNGSRGAFANGTAGSALPPQIVNECQQRNQGGRDISYIWKVERQETTPQIPNHQQQEMRKKLDKGLAQILRARGMTDASVLQADINDTANQMTSQWNGTRYESSASWRFSQDGNTILVNGTVGSNDRDKIGYQQLYSGKNCIVENTLATIPQQIAPLDNPFVWSADGNATMYRCPLIGKSLDLTPAHFVMLMNLDPLNMFGAHWALGATTASTWVIRAKIISGVLSPATIEMSLSRSHDAAPKEITIKGPGYVETFDALSYRRYNNQWICDRATYELDQPRVHTLKEAFLLDHLSIPQLPDLTLNPRRTVEDYRLLGPDFISPSQFLPGPSVQQAGDVVYYTWSGRFPSVDDLKKLFEEQHPGEATPDPDGKTSMLPTVGGLACLIGGILTYRRRDKGAA